MTRDEYRAALGQLALTQEEAGRILGVEGRTVRRWASGAVAVPAPIELMVRMWLELPELVDVARRMARERDEKAGPRAA